MLFRSESVKLNDILVNEAKIHPKKFANVGIPTLESVVALFEKWPEARAFVEIKQESIDAFGIEKVIKTLVSTCASIIDRCILIAYDDLALRCGRAMGFNKIGWILKKYNDESMSTAAKLNPDYLFCNYEKLPKKTIGLWPGPWQWAFYEVTQPKVAFELAELGAKYVETMAVAEMLKNPELRDRSSIVD